MVYIESLSGVWIVVPAVLNVFQFMLAIRRNGKGRVYEASALLLCVTTIFPCISLPIRAQEQKPIYSFAEIRRDGSTGDPKKYELFIEPLPDYDLPLVQMSFRLTVRNLTGAPVLIKDPLETLRLAFFMNEFQGIEVPSHVAGFTMQSEYPIRQLPAAIKFVSAVVNGREEREERTEYRLEPQNSLVSIFVCEKVIGDRILAALERSDRKAVDVVVTLSIVNMPEVSDTQIFRATGIRMSIPKPVDKH